MTTLPARRTLPPKRGGLIAAIVVGAIAIGTAVPTILHYYGPWASDSSASASTGLTVPGFGNRVAADPNIEKLQKRVKDQPNDFVSEISLANAYLQKVREVGDPTYYTKAEGVLALAAKAQPGDGELFASQGILALGRHDFARALTLGKQALAIDNERARYYGVVSDAQIELGDYEGAINNLQEMVNRKPDFASFSRVAYARELTGDPEGAIEAMQTAIEAGSSVPENLAWAHVQIGNLQFNLGQYDAADKEYALALGQFANYATALGGQGQVAAARGDLDRAKDLYTQAFDRIPLSTFAIALGDIAAKQGDTATAQRQYGLVRSLDKLYTANGQNTDLELALFFADHKLSLDEALQRARAGYAARPSIHGADVLAWTLYQSGKPREAQQYATESLKLGSRDPLLLFHAGMIAKANGDAASAKEMLGFVAATNPRFSLLFADDAAAALKELS